MTLQEVIAESSQPYRNQFGTQWTQGALESLWAHWTNWNFPLNRIAAAIEAETGLHFTRNACIGKARRDGFPHRQQRNILAPRRPKAVGESRIFQSSKIKPPQIFLPRIEDHNIPVEQRKTLLELTAYTCRWPVGTVGEPDFFFCGGDAPDHSYCPAHRLVAEQPVRR